MTRWIKRLLAKRAIAKFDRENKAREAKVASWRNNLKSGTRAVIFEEITLGKLKERPGAVLYFHPTLNAYAFKPDIGAAQKFYAAEEFFPESSL